MPGGLVETSAYLFEVIAALAYLAIGARLIRLGLRTRELPERLLGTYFILTGAAYAAYEIPAILGLADWVDVPFAYAGRVLYDIGMIPWLLFMRRVFHPDDDWARWLVGSTALFVGLGLIGTTATGDYEGVAIRTLWFWLDWIGYTLPFAWLAVASLSGYRHALRRQGLGLVGPLVTNRYLLWGIFGVVQVLVSLAIIAMYVDYGRAGVYSVWSDALVGGLEIASLAILWLVFFALSVYRRWLEASAGEVACAGAG